MDIEIIDAILLGHPDHSNVWMIGVELTTDDGVKRKMAYRIPEEAFETRAAELGLDPEDRDTLLETILFTPHLGDPSFEEATDPDWVRTRIAAKKNGGKIRSRNRRNNENPVTAPTGRYVVLTDAKQDPLLPLEVLKRDMLIDPEMVQVKRRIFQDIKNAHLREQTTEPVDYRKRPTATERLEQHLSKSRHRPDSPQSPS